MMKMTSPVWMSLIKTWWTLFHENVKIILWMNVFPSQMSMCSHHQKFAWQTAWWWLLKMVSNVYDHSSSSSNDNEYMMKMCNYVLKSMSFLEQKRLLKKAGSQLICQPFLFKKITPESIALFVPQWFWMSALTVSVAMDLPVIFITLAYGSQKPLLPPAPPSLDGQVIFLSHHFCTGISYSQLSSFTFPGSFTPMLLPT